MTFYSCGEQIASKKPMTVRTPPFVSDVLHTKIKRSKMSDWNDYIEGDNRYEVITQWQRFQRYSANQSAASLLDPKKNLWIAADCRLRYGQFVRSALDRYFEQRRSSIGRT
jgi:hypothetical protein